MSIGEGFSTRPDIQRFRIELLTTHIMGIVGKYISDTGNDPVFDCHNELLEAMLTAKLEWSTETDRKIAETKSPQSVPVPLSYRTSGVT